MSAGVGPLDAGVVDGGQPGVVVVVAGVRTVRMSVVYGVDCAVGWFGHVGPLLTAGRNVFEIEKTAVGKDLVSVGVGLGERVVPPGESADGEGGAVHAGVVRSRGCGTWRCGYHWLLLRLCLW